jgi:RpiR family carbohydrate utilization transcriptional regulator
MVQDVLGGIRRALAELSPAEAKVAQAILADPPTAMRASISRLAQSAGVSEPTVNRFCHSLGHDGYAAFRLALAQALGSGAPFVSADVGVDDPPEAYARKIFLAGAEALHRAARQIDAAAVGAAVRLLAEARQILVLGVGGSGPVALDAVHKLARLDVPTAAHLDPVMQRMAALAARPGDAVLAISSTGRTQLVIDAVALARGSGAKVVAITCPGSPLAAAADVTLGVEPAEDSDLCTPMASRLAHLTMIDVLLTGIVLARGPDLVARLARIKAGLNETRLPVNGA